MMTRILIPLLCLTALAPAAGALKVQVWDRELQTKVGDGESSGNKLMMQFVGNYDGPVVILFGQTDEEKSRVTFPGLKSSYNGTLSKGQLTLQVPGASKDSSANTPLALSKFLTPYKLTLSAQPAGQSLSLPGLKSTDAPAKDGGAKDTPPKDAAKDSK